MRTLVGAQCPDVDGPPGVRLDIGKSSAETVIAIDSGFAARCLCTH